MDKKDKLELFAIVELFGHQKISGKVSEQTWGNATFIRIDVPETKTVPAFTRFVNPTAVYAINPVTEDVMKIKAEAFEQSPINVWDVKKMHEKLLALNYTEEKDDDENIFD